MAKQESALGMVLKAIGAIGSYGNPKIKTEHQKAVAKMRNAQMFPDEETDRYMKEFEDTVQRIRDSNVKEMRAKSARRRDE